MTTKAAEKLLNPKLKTKAQRLRVIAVAELAAMKLASDDFIFFLDYVYILEPPQPLAGITGGKTPLEKWPYIMELADDLLNYRLIERLKARQMGFSWIVSAFYTWMLRFKDGSNMLELSRGQVESQALLRKAKFIYRHLPESWKIPIDKNSGSEFSLEGMTSKIIALPSTEDSGRGEAVTSIFQDEADFHEALSANYLAIKPTIDAGGQLIMGSTINKKNNRSLFKNIYRGAPDNGWHKAFWGWDLRPGRDQAWYDRVAKEARDLPDAQELGVDLYMEQEYPSNEQEALKPANALAAFDLENLERMRLDVKQPISDDDTKKLNKHINIYQKVQWRKAYAAGTDPSHGVGQDFAVTCVIDKDTGYVVADIVGQGIAPDELASASLELMQEYNSPRWAIEDNEWGIVVLNAAIKAKYPYLYKRRIGRTGSRQKGWHTDKATRAQLWFDLIDSVDSGGVTVPNLVILNQFFTVIRHPDNDYRPEAMVGEHDDGPMAVGLALQAATQATRRSSPEPANSVARQMNLMPSQASWHGRF